MHRVETVFRPQLLMGMLLFFLCAATLNAYPLEKIPPASLPSSFLLVATEPMFDPRFSRTVILVTRHGNGGAIGLIVNRPHNITLERLFPAYPAAKNLKLFDGGPVYQNQISFLVRGAGAAEGVITVSKDLYIAYDMSLLNELLSGKRSHSGLRVVNGLAVWAPGQLENEIKLGGWFVMSVDDAAIFDRPPETMWQELFGRVGATEI